MCSSHRLSCHVKKNFYAEKVCRVCGDFQSQRQCGEFPWDSLFSGLGAQRFVEKYILLGVSACSSDQSPKDGNMEADGEDIQRLLLHFSWGGYTEHVNTYLCQQFIGCFPVLYILSRKSNTIICDSRVCTVQ